MKLTQNQGERDEEAVSRRLTAARTWVVGGIVHARSGNGRKSTPYSVLYAASGGKIGGLADYLLAGMNKHVRNRLLGASALAKDWGSQTDRLLRFAQRQVILRVLLELYVSQELYSHDGAWRISYREAARHVQRPREKVGPRPRRSARLAPATC